MVGREIYKAHPAMFRAHPFWFIVFVLLIAAFGLGLLIAFFLFGRARDPYRFEI